MKCPDCKDGKYYPFTGPAEDCKTCGGTQLAPAALNPTLAAAVGTITDSRINLRQSDPHRGQWCHWKDHHKPELIGNGFIGLITDFRLLAVDHRDPRKVRKAICGVDDTLYDEICDLQAAAVLGDRSAFSVGPDYLLLIQYVSKTVIGWWHCHQKTAQYAMQRATSGHRKVGLKLRFESDLRSTGKFQYYTPRVEIVP